MIAKRLSRNGTIGIFCPSHIAEEARYSHIAETIHRLGFQVKLGANIYKDTYGFVASAGERAEDLNALIADNEVQMILFGGGDSAVEILPFIDYAGIRKHPKLFSSYSDGTSILNAIHAQTDLVTYYGMGSGEFADLRYYDSQQFFSSFVEGFRRDFLEKDSSWIRINGGKCAGTLIGGYAPYFGLMLSNRYFKYQPDQTYLLFLEDNESFSSVGSISTYLGFLEQSALMQHVSGMIFGHYSDTPPEDFLRCLERFGERNRIPVAYTDDFGHGTRHAVFPIGMYAELDADRLTLSFPGSAE